jgi:hypothetical protein
MATNSANYLRYGPIKLNIVKLNEYKKEPVYSDKERTHYMYTRHILSINAVVYPDTDIDYSELPKDAYASFSTCYTNEPTDGPNSNGGASDPAFSVYGNNPLKLPPVARIESLLRHMLMQPRQKLKYVVGDSVMLESPSVDALVDCNNGPKPVSLTVRSVSGLQSMVVEFVVSTDINESFRFGAPEYPMVSNQFVMEHEIDQDFYTTRKVMGVAHFRSDYLVRHKYSPDDFREWLNIPSPIGFKRDVVKCKLSPDSLKLEYSFVDREMHHHLDTRKRKSSEKATINNVSDIPYPKMKNITRLEVKQYLTVSQKSLSDSISSGINAVVNTITGSGGSAGSRFNTAFTGIKDFASSFMPLREDKIDITIYGNNLSEKHELEYLALFIIEKRIPYKPYSGMYTISLEEDVIGSFVKFHVTRLSGVLDTVDSLVNSNEATLSNIALKPTFTQGSAKFDLKEAHAKKLTFFQESQGIKGVTVKSFIDEKPNSDLQNLEIIKVRDEKFDQMRGTYLEQLFVESIRHNPDEPPLDDKTKKVFSYNEQNRKNDDSTYERVLPMGNDPSLAQMETE